MILLLLFIFLFAKNTLATSDFSVNQSVSYYLQDNGNASVTQDFQITNLISQIYLKEYVIKLDQTSLSQITAHDSTGSIIKSIDQTDKSAVINLKFNDVQVGRGQGNKFTLNYLVSQFAINKGKTYEIQLPDYQISDNENLTINLNVPNNFGELSFASVPVSSSQIQGNRYLINLDYRQIKPNGKILFVFGNHQLFDFKLNYYLTNPSNSPINTEIAVPPDTNGQKITFTSLSPPPTQINIDPDGNWLAQYTIPAKSQIDITVNGQAKIFPPINTPQNINVSRYLETKQFWPVDSPQVINTITNFTTPKDIYNFVVNYLNYDYFGLNQAKRQGALLALQNPSNALCTEFTDLFVTLSRAKSIPSREIEGYAYTNNPKIKPLNPNSDVLHAWPQYYDSVKQTWLSVDPTWEKTTNGIDYFNDLDLNHLVFVTHGIDSIYPPPPGSYRTNNQQKTVTVDFAPQAINTDISPPQLTLKNNQLTITNPNLISLNQVDLSTSNWHQNIALLPPLGQLTYKLPSAPLFHQTTIKISSAELNITTVNLTASKPIYQNPIIIVFLIVILSALGIIISVLPRQHEKNS